MSEPTADGEATDKAKTPANPLRHPTLLCALASAALFIIGLVLLIIRHSLEHEMFQKNGLGTSVYVPDPHAWLETAATWVMLLATALIIGGLVYLAIMKWRGKD